MNKIFKTFNFYVFLAILILGLVGYLMYGHCQTSKFHYIVQCYYMPAYLPKLLIIESRYEFDNLAVDKNYTGKWYKWDRSGRKRMLCEYEDGRLNGKSTEWSFNGSKIRETEYKDGIENGYDMMWHENGVKLGKSQYKDGKLFGKVIFWYFSGAKLSEGEYIDGKAFGKFIEWDENGKKIMENDWKDGDMIKDYFAPEK